MRRSTENMWLRIDAATEQFSKMLEESSLATNNYVETVKTYYDRVGDTLDLGTLNIAINLLRQSDVLQYGLNLISGELANAPKMAIDLDIQDLFYKAKVYALEYYKEKFNKEHEENLEGLLEISKYIKQMIALNTVLEKEYEWFEGYFELMNNCSFECTSRF